MRVACGACNGWFLPGGSSSVGRALAFQAGCREFESRLPLHFLGYGCASRNVCVKTSKNAHVAQLVERFLGKEEVHRFDSDRGLHYNIT